ncbi:hypothetical protein J7297_01852 [Nakaseomyces glabratus]|nr:hypothetical protein J7297_01852 [Nakaseomyces glabratus]KAH7593314.1 hypothetical protein J7296_01854 [Nakaseomyces glabratus]
MDEFNLDLFIIISFQMLIGGSNNAHNLQNNSTTHSANSGYNLSNRDPGSALSHYSGFHMSDGSPNSINSNLTNMTTPIFNSDNGTKFDDLYIISIFEKINNILVNSSSSSNLLRTFLNTLSVGSDTDYPNQLYKRFLGVRKELKDNYNESRFNQFFTANGDLRDYQTLEKNKTWSTIRNYILSIYDPIADKFLVPKSWTTNNSPRKMSVINNFTSSGMLSNLASNNNSNKDLVNYGSFFSNNKSLNGYYTQPTSPTPNDFSINFNLPITNNNNSNSNNSNNIPLPTGDEFDSAMVDMLDFPINTPVEEKFKRSEEPRSPVFVEEPPQDIVCSKSAQKALLALRQHYDGVISYNDEKIRKLEKELNEQRQESICLRKLLLEAMGSIRSTLNEMRSQ